VIEPAQSVYDEADPTENNATDPTPPVCDQADPTRRIFVNATAYDPALSIFVNETDTDTVRPVPQPVYQADTDATPPDPPIQPVQYDERGHPKRAKFTADTGDLYTLPRAQRTEAAHLRESTHTMNCITDAAVYEYDYGSVYESIK